MKTESLNFWKNTISDETYNKLRPVASKSGTLYRSAKVHEPLINGLPPFTPILLVIGIPSCKLVYCERFF